MLQHHRQSILLIVVGQLDYGMKFQKILYKSPGFTWNVIAYMSLVSRWMLKKWALEYGIIDAIGFSEISNDKLGNIIWDYQNMPLLACGRSITLGYLNSIRRKVQQKSTENHVRIDLNGCHMHWSLIITMKRYNVHHRLIRGTLCFME